MNTVAHAMTCMWCDHVVQAERTISLVSAADDMMKYSEEAMAYVKAWRQYTRYHACSSVCEERVHHEFTAKHHSSFVYNQECVILILISMLCNLCCPGAFVVCRFLQGEHQSALDGVKTARAQLTFAEQEMKRCAHAGAHTNVNVNVNVS